MKYIIELDRYELHILNDMVRSEYQKQKKACENKTGFDRDMLEDSAFTLLKLAKKLTNATIQND